MGRNHCFCLMLVSEILHRMKDAKAFRKYSKTTRLAVLIMTACTHVYSAGFQVRIEMDAGETLGVLSYRSGVTRHGSMVRPGKHMKYYEPRTRVSSLSRVLPEFSLSACHVG